MKIKILLNKRKILLSTIVVFLFINNVILGFNNLQNKRAIVGLRLNNRNVTGLTQTQIESAINEESAKNNRPLLLSYQDKIFQINQKDIGIRVDNKVLAQKILKVGRQDKFIDNLFDQEKALFGLKNIKLSGNISQALLTIKILDIASQINQEATSPTIDFANDFQKTLPAKEGLKVNTDKLTIIIVDNIFTPSKKPIVIPTMKTFPSHHELSELDPIRKEVQTYIKYPISITSGGLVFVLTTIDLRDMLTIVERPNNKIPTKTALQLRLDDKKLNQKLGEFANKVETFTHAEFDDHDARVAIYSQFYSKTRRTILIPTGRNLANSKVLGAQTKEGPKVVYLTFDDGPNSIYHPMILDILKTYNVKATFFLVGQNTQRDSEITKRTVIDGHTIGNHSLTHSFLPNLASSSILKELATTDDILKPFNNNQDIKLFRPPYGGVNLYVKKTAEDLGLKLFLWDVDPRDWSEPTVDELVRRIVSNTVDGSNILLHSNHLTTVKALPKIIETLRTQGFVFETLN